MTITNARPDFAHVLSRLKDFQRTTVEHAFHRLYEAKDASHRFLVADEVGLGKTVIASGVVARAIDHLWDHVDRIDIIYVCSNIDIARQNVNKLNVMGQGGFSSATRLTMLPLELSGLRANKVNFVSFTPGTSFDIQAGTGQARERALLYCMLKSAWNLGNAAAPINVMSGYSTTGRFRSDIEIVGDRKRYPRGIDPDLLKEFGNALDREAKTAAAQGRESLRQRFDALCRVFSRFDRNADRDELRQRNALIGELRHLLANTCIKALEPDLVILDEFQRFKEMLDGDNDAAELARELFTYSDDVVCCTRSAAVRDPVQDVYDARRGRRRRSLRRLHRDPTVLVQRRRCSRAASRSTNRISKSDLSGKRSPGAVVLTGGDRSSLRRVMARTERLAASMDRNGMLREVSAGGLQLSADDASTYCAFQKIGRELDQPDVVEFWKTAPFLLNSWIRTGSRSDSSSR